MFEDSLFESQLHAVSPRGRWTAFASIALQAAIASLLVIMPLLHTELLPERRNALSIVVPLPAPPPAPPKTVTQHAASALSAVVPVLGRMLAAPRITPSRIDTSPEPANLGPATLQMGSANAPSGLFNGVATPAPNVRITTAPEKKAGPVKVSSGVVAGLLLSPIQPLYPPIAKAARVEGTVVVEATISKAGTIESLHVVSGPAMLHNAALEAIRAARYRPFKLNGEPTEVQTTITVNFRMGG